MKNSRDVEEEKNNVIFHEGSETPQNEHMSASENGDDGPLPNGTTIFGGRYRILELMHQRPRVNLYLGRRLQHIDGTKPPLDTRESLVVIRELVLSDLPEQLQKQVERAAFEEFVSPAMFGSLRLPGAGDRVRVEEGRHYLIMQLRGIHAGGQRNGTGKEQGKPTIAITLAELLLNRRQWPSWLDTQTALEWGMQLCRIVARLHRLGLVLGDLDPNTVVVDAEGPAPWSPVLLVSWPPAPQFWAAPSDGGDAMAIYRQTFPIAKSLSTSAFAAPETCSGQCDARADIYSLGAILYLLLTRYAPVLAQCRQRKEQLELIPPHLFNARIPTSLEQVLLCALSLDPAQRYPTVFAFAEALERIDLAVAETQYAAQKASSLDRILRLVKHVGAG